MKYVDLFSPMNKEVNQFDEEEKKEIVEKKKSLALKISSRKEETYESTCEDEDAEMTMLARNTTNLLFKEIIEWGEEILEDTDSEMIFQEITKSHVLVVNSLDI